MNITLHVFTFFLLRSTLIHLFTSTQNTLKVMFWFSQLEINNVESSLCDLLSNLFKTYLVTDQQGSKMRIYSSALNDLERSRSIYSSNLDLKSYARHLTHQLWQSCVWPKVFLTFLFRCRRLTSKMRIYMLQPCSTFFPSQCVCLQLLITYEYEIDVIWIVENLCLKEDLLF